MRRRTYLISLVALFHVVATSAEVAVLDEAISHQEGSSFPVDLEQFKHTREVHSMTKADIAAEYAEGDRHAKMPKADQTELAAELVGRPEEQSSGQSPSKVATKTATKRSPHPDDHIEQATLAVNPGDDEEGPGEEMDDAGPAEEDDLGESAGVTAGVSEQAGMQVALGACEERASAPCGGHGQYVMKPAPLGLMDVSCQCDKGWVGPDCKGKCPVGQSGDGSPVPCSNNGNCRFTTHPTLGAACSCSNKWSGDTCEKCTLAGQCANGAEPDPKCQGCQCTNKWSGPFCSSCSLKCTNDGAPDDSCGKCHCKAHWTGETCSTCGLVNKCNHGIAKRDCSGCKCQGNWSGPRCDKCGMKCGNGVPNHTCTGCVCQNQWTGAKCDHCTLDMVCRNGARSSKSCDSCVCPAKTAWQGSFCHVCGLVCINGVPLKDCSQCKCVGNWGGARCDKCKKRCKYGTPDPMCMKCNCPGGWSGSECSTCAMKCSKGHVRDSTCTQCISTKEAKQRHSLAFDGDSNLAVLSNPVKHAEEISTIEFAFKALRVGGVQGLVCDQQQVMGSVCIRLVGDQISFTVFGNHITANDPVISGSTQTFPYKFRPFTGYRVSLVYALLHKGMAYTKLYVNGNLAGTKFFASAYVGRLGTTYVSAIQGNSHGYFQGFVDDLRLWNVVRMPWQIAKDARKHMVGVEQGLIAYFPMDVPELETSSLGVSNWEMKIQGAVYSDAFQLGRHN